jgi:transcription elongation factor Elf1
MVDDPYVVMMVECSVCQTMQKVHVAVSTVGAQVGEQSIPCLNCNSHFKVTVPDRIIREPFPA